MKQEFCKLVGIDPEVFPNEDWEKIEAVYLDHPIIRNVDGKQQVADIYKKMGMLVINDMYERVLTIRCIENEKKRIKDALCVVMGKKAAEIQAVYEKYSKDIADLSIQEDRINSELYRAKGMM